VRANSQILVTPCSSGLYEFHVSSAEDFSIRELATTIALECGQSPNRLKFGALAYRTNELMKSEIGLLPGLPHWQPRIGLSEGLRRIVEFEKLRLESLSENQ
jgi:nucleoside-diphosphate-sugar epimerase